MKIYSDNVIVSMMYSLTWWTSSWRTWTCRHIP